MNSLRYDPETNPDIKSLLSKKINLIFGDEVDETVVSGEDSTATTPDSDSVSSIGEGTEKSEDKKSASKKAAKKEKFRKLKENLVDAIWNQRKCTSVKLTQSTLTKKCYFISGKYNKDTLLMSPIFVALVTDYQLYEKDLSWCKYSLEYTLHPVFRIIKCRSKPSP